MGIMTGEAVSLPVEGLMRHGGLLDVLLLVCMAREAEVSRRLGTEVELEIFSVGIMAVRARIHDRSMGEFRGLGGIALVRMTRIAQIVDSGREEAWEIALVDAVAGGAAAPEHRAVNVFAGNHAFIMTHETQIRAGFPELKFIRRLMRVVTSGAIAVFYGRMNDFFRGRQFVTLGAELAHIGNLFEGVLVLLYMTRLAVASCQGGVNELVLAHLGMAFLAYAGFRFLSKYRAGAGEPETENGEHGNHHQR
jgi:hypothetical protein